MDGCVWVGVGLWLKNLCGLVIKVGFVGFEFFEGIFGNVGGVLCMNVGVMGGWMFDVVEEVCFMMCDGEEWFMKCVEMYVDYWYCVEFYELIVFGVLL